MPLCVRLCSCFLIISQNQMLKRVWFILKSKHCRPYKKLNVIQITVKSKLNPKFSKFYAILSCPENWKIGILATNITVDYEMKSFNKNNETAIWFWFLIIYRNLNLTRVFLYKIPSSFGSTFSPFVLHFSFHW